MRLRWSPHARLESAVGWAPPARLAPSGTLLQSGRAIHGLLRPAATPIPATRRRPDAPLPIASVVRAVGSRLAELEPDRRPSVCPVRPTSPSTLIKVAAPRLGRRDRLWIAGVDGLELASQEDRVGSRLDLAIVQRQLQLSVGGVGGQRQAFGFDLVGQADRLQPKFTLEFGVLDIRSVGSPAWPRRWFAIAGDSVRHRGRLPT